MIGVILAGGDGTRLAQSTGQNICKSLRKIKDKHLIEFALDNLINLGATKVYIVVGKQGDLIKKAIGDKYKSLDVNYVCQMEQIGLIDAFVQALKVIDDSETVVLQLADEILINLNTQEIKNAINNDQIDFYCGVTKEENEQKIKNNFSVETDDDTFLVKCVEKPKVVINDIKGTGFTVFSGKTQKLVKETYLSTPEKVKELCDSFNFLIEKGYRGVAFLVAEREFNINTLSDLTEAEEFLKD